MNKRETRSLSLREEHEYQMFEGKMLTKIQVFGPK